MIFSTFVSVKWVGFVKFVMKIIFLDMLALNVSNLCIWNLQKKV